jgi:hypothetical protein
VIRGSARLLFPVALIAAAGCERGPHPERTADSRPGAAAAFAMVDVSAESGVAFVSRSGEPGGPRFIPEAKGCGAAILDYDRDGVLDLFFLSGSTIARERAGEPGWGSALYRGLGGLKYSDVTAQAGIPALGWSSAPVAGDLDGDGYPEVLVTGLSGMRLLVNEKGRFREADARALPPTADDGWCTSGALFDVDQDGDLDAFVARYLKFFDADPLPFDGSGNPARTCQWKGHQVLCGPRGFEPLHAILLRNRGDGTFEDVTKAFGIDAVPPAYGLGVLTLDFNRDGRTDVYAANDMTPSHLWRNDGGRFTEVGVPLGVAYSADGAPEAGMGVDAADLNGDGIEDIVKTNFDGEPNDVYLSSRATGFDEFSARAGTAAVDRPHVGWGCALRDFDGDGILDFFVANGHVYAQADLPLTGTSFAQRKVLHLGRADGRFSALKGPGAAALENPKVSRAAAFGDLDDDGDTDAVVVNLNDRPTILRNDAPPSPWVGVRVAGPPRNPQGLGALVTLAGDGWKRSQVVRAHASFQSTNDPRVLFRLRPDEKPASIEVALPGRAAVRVERVQPGAWQEVRVP